MTRALQGFGHPAAYRRLDWDPRHVTGLRPYADHLPDERRRAPMHRLLDRFAGLDEATHQAPASALHGDVTLSNLLLQDDGITGVIDFGDMHHTARVAELAISLTSLLRESDDLWADAGRFLDGYQRVLPLEPAEVELIGELVLARSAAGVLISAWRAPLYPDNEEYLTSLVAGSWLILDQLAELDQAELAGPIPPPACTSASTAPDPTLLERRKSVLGGDLSPLFYRAPCRWSAPRVRGSTPPTVVGISMPTTTFPSSGTPIRPSCRRSRGRPPYSTSIRGTCTLPRSSWPSA